MDQHDGAPRLEFVLLHGVEARRLGRVLDLGPPQRRAVLAVLALRRRQWVSAQSLLEAMYDGPVPASGVGVVQTHVSALRRALEPGRRPRAPAAVLLSGHGGYQLRIEDDQLDLVAFDRAVAAAERARDRGDTSGARDEYARALGMFEGEALAGIPGPYAEHQRVALTERRLAVLEDSLRLSVEQPGHDQVVDELRMLIAEHPLRENPPAMLMRALQVRGRRAEALELYARTRRRFVEALGMEPGPGLRAAHQRILTGELPAVQGVSLPEPVPDRPRATPPAPRPLPGRDAELAVLDGFLAQLREGAGALVVIAGLPGHGRSALLRAAGRRARGCRTERIVATRPDRRRTLGLIDELHALVDGSDREGGAVADDHVLAQQLLESLRRAGAQRPLLVLIDDSAEADERSLGVLARLAPLLTGVRALLVLAIADRPWDGGPIERPAALERAADAVIRIGALDRTSVAAVAAHQLGRPVEDRLVAEIHAAAAGIPRLVIALCADLAALANLGALPYQLPEGSYSRALRGLLQRLPVEFGTTLATLAVLPTEAASLPILAAALGESETVTRQRCELLVVAGILDRSEPPELRHCLVHNTIARFTAPTEVGRIRVVAARQARLAGYSAVEVAAVLGDLDGAQWSEWTVVFRDAAQECVRSGDIGGAIEQLRAAARIAGPDIRDEVLVRMGRLEQFTNPAAAREHLSEALAGQRARAVAPTALIPLVWTLTGQREAERAVELVDEVLAEVVSRDAEAARLIRAARWVGAALYPDSRPRLVRQAVTAAPADAGSGAAADPVSSAIILWDKALRLQCTAAQALEEFPHQLYGGADEAEPLPRESTGLLALLALWADDLTLAWQLGEHPDERYFGAVDVYRLTIRTQILLRRGDFRAALAECAPVTAVPLTQRTRRPPALTAQFAHALVGTGQLDQAARWLATVVADTGTDSWEWLAVNTMRGRLASAQGRSREAAAYFLESGRRTVVWGMDNPGLLPWRSLAATELVRAGQGERARRLAVDEVELARRWGTERSMGLALAALAATGPAVERIAGYEQAARHLERSESLADRAPVVLELARARLAAGDRRTALRELELVREPARERGAMLLVREIDALRRS